MDGNVSRPANGGSNRAPFTEAAMAGYGALLPFTGTGAKDPLPPMAAIRAVGCVAPVTEFLYRCATLSVFAPLKRHFDGGPLKTR